MEGPERLRGLLDPENGDRTQCTDKFSLSLRWYILTIQENELHEAERVNEMRKEKKKQVEVKLCRRWAEFP